MFKRYVPAGVVLALIIGLLLLKPWGSSVSTNAGTSTSVPTAARTPSAVPASPSTPVLPVPRAVAKKKNVSEQERERYRRAIQDALSKRDETSSTPTQRAAANVGDARPASEGGLKDRSGGKLSGLLTDLREDVMPLADECYALARERNPQLAGGLDLRFEIIGDADVGGLVESVEWVDSSDIEDADLITCMRETLLSTIFPAPADSGSTGVQLSLRFSPDD